MKPRSGAPPDARGTGVARHVAGRPRATALILVALVFAGCGSRTYLTPEVAGVVESLEGGIGTTMRFTLVNGRAFTIDLVNLDDVVYGGGPPQVGDLLLGGTGPDGPWVARLRKSTTQGVPAECYQLDGDGTDRGDWIETDAGFRLPKAQGFDPGLEAEREGERYTNALTPSFCVNPDGQVISFG